VFVGKNFSFRDIYMLDKWVYLNAGYSTNCHRI
jgi:hypothetical protein